MAGYTEHINIVVLNLEDGGCSKEIVAQFVELAGILHGCGSGSFKRYPQADNRR